MIDIDDMIEVDNQILMCRINIYMSMRYTLEYTFWQ